MKRPHIASIVATLLVGLVTACTEPNPIDNYPVALRLDLTFNDKALRTVPSAAIYTRYSHPISSAYQAFGFGGVLVVHGVDAEFYAFDLSCPYENRSSVRVEPDSDIIYAVCPQCGTKYLINDGSGVPVEGVGRHGLKPYRTESDGRGTVIVYN